MTELSRRWAYIRSVENRAAMVALALLVIVLLTLFCLLGYVLWANRPAVAMATEPVILPQQAASQQGVWQRIQARGSIIAGVSANYPPFAYVNPGGFDLQGFDIALVNELGRRLGVPVQFENMAFDGLFSALQLGQIDLAVGGISVTPERQLIVDFSDVYYQGEDAVLAPANSPVAIVAAPDLARYRVGVERGSTHEAWLSERLVTPGLMPAQQLVQFDNIEAALSALTGPAPTVDVVVVDLVTARAATQGRPVRIVAQGMNPQQYAIAIPKDANTFRTMINQELLAMQQDGTLNRLAQQYFQVALAPPPATPQILPTAAVVPPVAVLPTAGLPQAGGAECKDAMEFVSDLNYPDNDMVSPAVFAPGQSIQKGWRIRNIGDCTWDEGYSLVYDMSVPKEAKIKGQPVALSGRVAPGATTDIYVTVTAPTQPGVYQSQWALRSPRGEEFGDKLWVGIQVSAAGSGGQPAVNPQPNLQTSSAGVSLFTAEPKQVTIGQCLTLSWQYDTAGVTQAVLYRGSAPILQSAPAKGTFVDCPPAYGVFDYRLALERGSGASSVAVAPVNVLNGGTGGLPPSAPAGVQPTPAGQTVLPPQTADQTNLWSPPAAAPDLSSQPSVLNMPAIQVFQASLPEVVWGQCVQLTWSFSGGPGVQSQLFREGDEIARNLPPSGSQQECPPGFGLTTYRLEISSSTAGIQDAELYVHVLPLAKP